MSRIAIALSLVTALSSFAVAEKMSPGRMDPGYATRLDEEPVVVDRAQARAALAKVRAENLATFRAYAKAGVFPSNVYQGKLLNVWRDQDGHLCAAATIIWKSGQHDLVDRVADQNNFIKLADIKQGPLMDWILTSGFTQEELVAIQKPFNPVTRNPEPAPQNAVAVDASMRATETARLAKLYKQVDKDLADNEQKSLDLAVDRLMKHPELGIKLVN